MKQPIFFIVLLSAFLSAKPLVVATTADLASLAREVAGEALEIKSITSGKDDLHSIEARPSFALLLSRADALLIHGAELDSWIDPAVESSRNFKIQKGAAGHLDASKWAVLKDIPTGFLDRALGHLHASGNPHYLLDPENGLRVVARLSLEFSKLFPGNKTLFTSNAFAYSNTLSASMERWKKMAAPLRGQGFVSHHSDWRYFADFFGMEDVISLEPKPGIPPTPAQLKKVTDLAKARNLRYLIQAIYDESRPGEWVAAKTGVKVSRLAPQVGALPGVESYPDLFEVNLKILLSHSN